MDRSAEFFELLGVEATKPTPIASRSKVLRKLATLVTGIDRTETRLREVASDYAAPCFVLNRGGSSAAGMSDGERDAIEAQVTGFLVECRAALDQVSRESSLCSLETGALRIALDKTKALSSNFNKLQQLRYHRDLQRHHASAPPPASKDDPWRSRFNELTRATGRNASRQDVVAEPKREDRPVVPEQQRALLQKEREILASEVERDLDVRSV